MHTLNTEPDEATDEKNKAPLDIKDMQKQKLDLQITKCAEKGAKIRKRHRRKPEELASTLQPTTLTNINGQISRSQRDKILTGVPEGPPITKYHVKTHILDKHEKAVKIRNYIPALDERLPNLPKAIDGLWEDPDLDISTVKCTKLERINFKLSKKLQMYEECIGTFTFASEVEQVVEEDSDQHSDEDSKER